MTAAAAKTPVAPPAADTTRMDGGAWAMLLALSALWGGSFVFVEIILTAVPVLTLVAFRVVIAAAILWSIVILARVPLPRDPAIFGAFAVMGLLNNAVPFSLIVFGQTAITAGLAAILTATTPLFAALIAGALLSDEQLSGRKIGGLVFGLLGVTVMIGPAALGAVGDNVLHQLAVVGAAASYGFAAVYGRRFRRLGVTPLTVSAGQLTASSLIMVPAALLVDGPAAFLVPSAGIWAAILANAAISTAGAYLLYFRILARAGATNVSLVTVLVPVVAGLVGALALGERLDLRQFAGMALIFAALAVIDGRLLTRLGLTPASRAPRNS